MAVLSALLLIGAGRPASGADTPRVSRDIALGAGVWTETDLALQPGEQVSFAAQGSARCPGTESSFGPAGMARGFRDLLRILPMPQAGRGALIGRIGATGVALPFVVGETFETTSVTGGPLSLGVNRTETDGCTASFIVHVDIYAPKDGAGGRVPTMVETIAGVDNALFANIPRRIGDLQGNPGDMVNFLIVGSEAQMKRMFTTAGWVVVDPDVKGAVISGLISSLSKESYLTLPMSQLYLFGRPQDFGWAHAEPIKVAASRHHLRVWRAPFTVNGATAWVGAATHDIGFERDRRNNGITHKIDPDIDLERGYVQQTLTATGHVSAFTYFTPDNPLREAKTATGGSFHSDGRVLILMAADDGAAAAIPAR